MLLLGADRGIIRDIFRGISMLQLLGELIWKYYSGNSYFLRGINILILEELICYFWRN
jgi:hypothetical protein